MKRKVLSLVLAMVFVMSMLSACASKDTGKDTSGSSGNSGTQPTAATTEQQATDAVKKLAADGKPARDDVHLAVILPSLGHEFWKNCLSLMQSAAKELNITLDVYNAEDNADKAAEYVETALGSGIDGLIFVAYFDMGPKALETAKNAGNIPVIIIDAYIPTITPGDGQYDNYLAFIGPSDQESGYQMAKALFDNIQPNDAGEIVVGVVNGTSGSTVAIDRRKGFQQAYDEYTQKGIKIRVAGEVTGDFVRDKSQEVTESLLQGNPDIKGIWAANGGTASGVLAAVNNLGYKPGKDILIVGMDLNSENVESVRNGDILFDIGGHWLQGVFAEVMLYDYLNGYPLPDDRNVKLTPIPVFKDDVDKFLSVFVDYLPPYDVHEYSRTFNSKASAVPPALNYK